jgi:hypothetical protein
MLSRQRPENVSTMSPEHPLTLLPREAKGNLRPQDRVYVSEPVFAGSDLGEHFGRVGAS